MKAWEIVAYVDTDDCVVYCDDCGVDGRHHPIFACDRENLEKGEVCRRCHVVWDGGEWCVRKRTALDVMGEAIDDDG